jgi:hypothetical protein
MRFNGFFFVPNFIIHDAGIYKQVGGQLSEADLLAVRMPHENEVIKGDGFEINVQQHAILGLTGKIMDFAIVEVCSEQCKFNWIDTKSQKINQNYLDYALRRFGWWSDPSEISAILAEQKRFEIIDEKAGIATRVRLLSFGKSINPDLKDILQITFGDVLHYMKEDLFMSYGRDKGLKKIVSDHKQWDKLICEVYNKLLGHRVREHSVGEVLKWIFPNANTE